jgi:hypothetical protein
MDGFSWPPETSDPEKSAALLHEEMVVGLVAFVVLSILLGGCACIGNDIDMLSRIYFALDG